MCMLYVYQLDRVYVSETRNVVGKYRCPPNQMVCVWFRNKNAMSIIPSLPIAMIQANVY